MSPLFNSLQRSTRYTFTLTNNTILTFTFHEICPDGTLKVATDTNTFYLNPAHIIMVRRGT